MNDWMRRQWGSLFLALMLMASAGIVSCRSNEAKGNTEANVTQRWYYGKPLYEVYVRAFSPGGTFKALDARLDSLKDAGLTNIWLMPIFPIGEVGRKGSMGSPYSVRDYFTVGREYGTEEDFRALVNHAHDLGMHVILDMVMNHSANDHVEMKNHPDWFAHDSSGSFTREVADWSDVTDWDYDNPGARDYLENVLLYWVREFGVDGYRCDVAGMVPQDFWEEVIPRLREIKPDVFMLAEWEDEWVLEAGFDAAYDWTLFHRIVAHADNRIGLDSLWNVIENRQRVYPRGKLPLRFVENHDEKRSASVFGWPGVKPYAGLIFSLPGIPLIYNGQEAAATVKPSLFEQEPIDWHGPNSAQAKSFYTSLVQLRNGSRALQAGDLAKVDVDDPEVLVFTRTLEDEQVLAAVNFSADERMISLPAVLVDGDWRELAVDGAPAGRLEASLAMPPLALRLFEKKVR